MSFASKVLYTGDAATKSFNIPFPYISNTHLRVYVDQILQLNPMNYTLSGASTVLFGNAPWDGAAIVIQRWTSPTATLVDFVNGSVLNESDLDTSYLHNFYLSQEYADSFNEVINAALVNVATGAGIVETETDEVVAALVNFMLQDANAANLQARVTDIDDNAEAIITLGEGLQVQINSIGAGFIFIQAAEPVPGVGGVPDPITDGSRWYDSDDGNRAYVYQSLAWLDITDDRLGQVVSDVSVLGVSVDDNAAAIVTEQTARATADSAFASDIALIGAVNGAESAFILDTSTVKIDSDGGDTFATAFARQAISLDVNGYVTGYEQINDGTYGSFNILADQFGIVTPSFVWQASTAYAVDDMIRPTSPTSPSRVFKCTTAGTSGGTEPTWNTTVDGTTNDGTAVWTTFDDAAIVPFQILGNEIRMTGNVVIDGSLMLNGSILGDAIYPGTIGTTHIGTNAIDTDQLNAGAVTANKINANEIDATHIVGDQLDVLAGNTGTLFVDESITMNAAGHIKGGQTAFSAGTGYFMGYESSAYKFSIGNATDFLEWDGSSLIVRGNISVGEYIASTSTVMLAADIERSTFGTGWTEIKKFEINRPGTVRVYYDRKCDSTVGGFVSPSWWRTMLDGVEKDTSSMFSDVYFTDSFELTLGETAQYITVEYKSGFRNPSDPQECGAFIRNCQIKADKSDGETVVTD